MDSATSATRVMLPNAVTKSLQAISRCNLPSTTLQPFIFGSSALISSSLSFFAAMAFFLRTGSQRRLPLSSRTAPTATFSPRLRTRIGCHGSARAELRVTVCSLLTLNAPAKSTIVGVSLAAPKGGKLHAPLQDGDIREKEDSRHPIWCRPYRCIHREVDAGEAGHRNHRRDRSGSRQGGTRSGRSCGRKRCALGRQSVRRCARSPRPERRRGYPLDFFLAWRSDGPIAGLPRSAVVYCFDLRGIVLPVSHPSGTRRQARRRRQRMGRGARRNRCEPRIRDGQTRGDAGRGFATHRTGQSAAYCGRLEAADSATEENRRGHDRG